ncbi:DNA gyrase inhibitor YacG [Bradyrhizobium erythrophlei]|uniref:DNA gyrase inhibitor YacG n=1 Tax=Bradyrhizobium erythrophlei TaxID=1437360 RepID=UPI0035E975F2
MNNHVRKPQAAPRTCPICSKPVEQAFRPFCSPRCRDVDLNRWLTGAYVVPGREDDAEDPE